MKKYPCVHDCSPRLGVFDIEVHGWDHLICQHISTMKSSKGSESGPAILSLVLSGNWGNDAISSVNPGSTNYRLSWFIMVYQDGTPHH